MECPWLMTEQKQQRKAGHPDSWCHTVPGADGLPGGSVVGVRGGALVTTAEPASG